MQRVQSKYPYVSFGKNLDYNPATQTYTTKTLFVDGFPVTVVYSTVPGNWEFSPKAKGGRGYKRLKKSYRNIYKKRSYGKRTRKYYK